MTDRAAVLPRRALAGSAAGKPVEAGALAPGRLRASHVALVGAG